MDKKALLLAQQYTDEQIKKVQAGEVSEEYLQEQITNNPTVASKVTMEEVNTQVNELLEENNVDAINKICNVEIKGNILLLSDIKNGFMYKTGTTKLEESENNDFAVVKVEIKENEYYSINSSKSTVSTTRSCVCDADLNILGTITKYGSSGIFQMPSDAKYLCLCYLVTNITNGVIVVKGIDSNVFTASINDYPYGGTKKYEIYSSVINHDGTYTLEVSPYGDKPFKTIESAFNVAKILESDSTPVTILIHGGVYNETINAGYRKNISFVGINKHDVIWKSTCGVYGKDALRYSGNGIVKDITFIANHDDDTEFETKYATKTETNYSSYGLHLDTPDDYEEDGEYYETVVEDCIIYCNHSAVIGCGMSPNQKLTIRNCELIMNVPENLINSADGKKGAFLIHRAYNITSNKKQICYFYNNIIRTNNKFSYQISDFDTETHGMELHLYNNISWSDVNGKTDESVSGSTFTLAQDNYGNNVSKLNA